MSQIPQDAYALCIQKIQRPVFMNKLARDWGVVPQSAQEENRLLELGGMLREAQEIETAKSAAAGSSGNHFLDEATDNLKIAMNQLGYGHVDTSREFARKQAAASLAQDDSLCDAVIALAQAVS
jgi:hypothetical protein